MQTSKTVEFTLRVPCTSNVQEPSRVSVSPGKRQSAHPQVQEHTGAIFLKLPFDYYSTCCHL